MIIEPYPFVPDFAFLSLFFFLFFIPVITLEGYIFFPFPLCFLFLFLIFLGFHFFLLVPLFIHCLYLPRSLLRTYIH